MKREKLSAYTERAIRATEAGKLIPPVVYLPRLLRSKPTLLTEANCALRLDPPTIEDQTVRIQEADPWGLLIAIMNGQPIPEFRITNTGNIALYYNVPKLQERMRAAEWLAGPRRGIKLGQRKGGATDAADDEDHAAMLERATSDD